jgi:hypothetical protein
VSAVGSRPSSSWVRALQDIPQSHLRSLPSETFCVYFAEEEGGYIKIGVSRVSTVLNRIAHLRNANPREITLRRIVEGDITTEKRLHRYFEHLYVRGEWFVVDDELAKIARIPSDGHA